EASSATALTTAFYGRSSARQVPRLTRRRSEGIDVAADEDRPRLYILPDQRFESDIDWLARRILLQVFRGGSVDTAKLLEEYIEPINDALQRIFRGNTATSLV